MGRKKRALVLISAGLLLSFAGLSMAASSFESSDIGGMADPFDAVNEQSLAIFFNNFKLTDRVSGADDTGVKAWLPTARAAFRHDGTDISFNGSAAIGYGTHAEDFSGNDSGINVWKIDLGVDLNYIIANANKLFLSAGVMADTSWPMISYDRTVGTDPKTNTALVDKSGQTPIISLLGVDARAAYYLLQEIYLTGRFGMGFLSLYSIEKRWDAAGDRIGDHEISKPFQTVLEINIAYRPTSKLSIWTGVGYDYVSYLTADYSVRFSSFTPRLGLSVLY